MWFYILRGRDLPISQLLNKSELEVTFTSIVLNKKYILMYFLTIMTILVVNLTECRIT